jgi:putative ABC transport system ATP-binding protein
MTFIETETTMDSPVIKLDGVTKVYRMGDNDVRALRGVNLTVHRGEMIAVMGASGSGKSTLMNILGCLDVPTAGSYLLDDTIVNGLSRNALADLRNHKLGFVFQGFNLLSRTSALDNVELPLLYRRGGAPKDTRRRAQEALERVGLGARLDHHPSALSGGQQQRVAIARAMVTEPTLLLADEPTGNLDSRTSVEVMALFQALNDQGITILIVTHEPDIAQYAKRVVEVRDGQILRDHPITNRRSALDDLNALDDAAPAPAQEAA